MHPSPDLSSPRRRPLLRALAIGVLSGLFVTLAGLLPITGQALPFWPAAALALAFGWRFGRLHTLSASAGASLAALLLTGSPALCGLGFVTTSAGPIAALLVLDRATRRAPATDRLGALARFLGAASFIAAPLNALLWSAGLAALGLASDPSGLTSVATGWLIELVACLLITPAVLAILGPSGRQVHALGLHTGALAAALVLAAAHLLLDATGSTGTAALLPVGFLALATWTATRASERTSALSTGLLAGLLFGAHALTAPITLTDLLLLLVGTIVALLVQAIAADRAAAMLRLREQGHEDPATGLPNDQAMTALLSERLSVASRPDYGLIGVQIGNLEAIHDLAGADRATAAEQGVASLLMRLHADGRIARLAAGRYAVLLPCEDIVALRRVARELYARLNGLSPGDPSPVRMTASVGGLLIGRRTSVHSEDCLSSLAEAMAYAAGARDPQLFVEPLSQASIDTRRDRQRQLEFVRQAIREQRFELYAEPMLDPDAPAGTLSFEVLTRLRGPGDNGTLIMPREFIPLAAESRLTNGLDRGVVHRVFDWLAANPRALERTHRCSINLSGPTISDPGTATYLREQRMRFDIPPEKIVFEITEGEAIRSPAAAARLLDELRAEGFSIALDDFGTGLSSFDYLKRFPVDYLKIDGSFVRHLLESPIDEEIVLATVRVARRIGIRTTAEHVRDEATLARLTELGVDVMQGELIGRPVPIGRLFERRASERSGTPRMREAAGPERRARP